MPPPKAVRKTACAILMRRAPDRNRVLAPVMTSCTWAAADHHGEAVPARKLSARRPRRARNLTHQAVQEARGLSRCTITGWFGGRPLLENLTTAAGFLAFAPSSKGRSRSKCTSSPSRNRLYGALDLDLGSS